MNVGSPHDQIHTWGLNVLHLLQAPVRQSDFFFMLKSLPPPPLLPPRVHKRSAEETQSKGREETKKDGGTNRRPDKSRCTAAPGSAAVPSWNPFIWDFILEGSGGGLRQRCSAGYTWGRGVHVYFSVSMAQWRLLAQRCGRRMVRA